MPMLGRLDTGGRTARSVTSSAADEHHSKASHEWELISRAKRGGRMRRPATGNPPSAPIQPTGGHRPVSTRLALLVVLLALLQIVGGLSAVPVAARSAQLLPTEVRDPGVELEEPPGSPIEQQGQSDLSAVSDPLNLIPEDAWAHPHSLGVDIIEVWVCGHDIGFDEWTVPSPATYADRLKNQVAPWFEFHSRGRYDPRFIPGSITNACVDQYIVPDVTALSSSTNLVATIWPWGPCCYGGGAGSAGDGRSSANLSGRGMVVGNKGDEAQSIARNHTVHELGHTLYWPHSFIADSLSYDVVHDVMSGNEGSEEAYGTAVINYYSAGWIDSGEVVVIPPGGTTVTLVPTGSSSSGKRMAVIPDGLGSAWVLGARVSGPYDAIPTAWQGVEIYHVDADEFGGPDVKPYGARPAKWDDPSYWQNPNNDFLTSPIPHIIPPGKKVKVDGVDVTVSAASGGYRVVFGPGAPLPVKPPVRSAGFWDTQGHIFESAIDWLAAEGITQGCNPPDNFLFCPDQPVTRGQMATFLARALGLPSYGGPDRFRDDDGHIFETAIEKFAQAGITVGCNPPANERFCPDRLVTRGQMAAFLVRAFNLPDYDGPDRFRDDNGSVFEGAIERLAQAGITVGCNPPANDQFCPDNPIRRGQMAAFLKRAFEE